MYYIHEADKPNIILKMFNIIKLETNQIIIPIEKGKELSQKNLQILAKKTNDLLKKANCKKIVISKEIKKQEQYINYLNTYNFEIVDGKWLFEVLSQDVLEYIMDKKKLEKKQIQISVLVNDLSDIMLNILKNLIKKYKKLNIVTNHIEKFKKLEEDFFNEDGTIIVVNNNKKKSLSKSQIILNIDFPSELINKYKINEEAIIVNIWNSTKIKNKRFNGLNINNYEINFQNIEEIDYNQIEKYDNRYQKFLKSKDDITYNHIKSIHSKKAIDRMSKIKINENYLVLDENIKSVHSGSYGRLNPNGIAPTITTRFDTPSGGRFIHPYENRTLTPREAARIQSFPDSFIFTGNKSCVCKQIGNAVPPKLAYFFGIMIRRLLENDK